MYRILQGKFVSASPGRAIAPPGRARVNFYDIFAGRVRGGGSEVVYLVVLAHALRATTKKVVDFFEENSAHPEKILATRMLRNVVVIALMRRFCSSEINALS